MIFAKFYNFNEHIVKIIELDEEWTKIRNGLIFSVFNVLLAMLNLTSSFYLSSPLLTLHSVIITILLLANLILNILLTNVKMVFVDQLKETFEIGLRNYKDNPVMAFALQNIQQLLSCCGWFGGQDFHSDILPASCCDQYVEKQVIFSISCKINNTNVKDGCQQAQLLNKLLDNILLLFAYINYYYAALIILSCYLATMLNTFSADHHIKLLPKYLKSTQGN